MNHNPHIDGVPTIEIPKNSAIDTTKMLQTMHALCVIKGRAKRGDVAAQAVYFQASSTPYNPANLSNYQPSGPWVSPSTQAGQEGTFLATFVVMQLTAYGANRTRYFQAFAEYPNASGPGGPMEYFLEEVEIQLEEVMSCPTLGEGVGEPVEPLTPSRTLQEADVDAARGWTLYDRLPVNRYPGGTLLFDAATREEVAVLGVERRLAVFAPDVDWRHGGLGTPTGVYSPVGNGVAALSNSGFFLPGAPQYCILLWQPYLGPDFPAVYHVVTASRRVDSQVLSFDRRRPIYAQVNDYRGDAYAANAGGFTLAIRQLN